MSDKNADRDDSLDYILSFLFLAVSSGALAFWAATRFTDMPTPYVIIASVVGGIAFGLVVSMIPPVRRFISSVAQTVFSWP